jgi:SAM-dependent methyltransferase
MDGTGDDNAYFAAGAPVAAETGRLTLLERIYDPDTIAWVERTGVAPGWRCLVPGAGHGSMARWLADRVGPTGSVVATDINTDVLGPSARANLEVRRHDIVTDELEPEAFDLVLVRFLLTHLVGRQDVAVDRLVGALRPGGWLVVDETDVDVLRPADPGHPAHDDVEQRFETAYAAIQSQIDVQAGRHVSALIARHGQLTLVAHEARARLWAGGSLHAQFVIQTNEQGRTGTTVSAEDVDVIDAALRDPNFWYLGELHHHVIARRTG